MGFLVRRDRSSIEQIHARDGALAYATPRRQRLRRMVLLAVLAAVILAIAGPIALWVRYRHGHVVSRNAMVKGHIADVGVRMDGVVVSVEVDNGDRVRAGQVVARLEDRHIRARVQQAKSQLEKSTRELEVEGMSIDHERRRFASSVREAAAQLAAAEAQVQAAESRADDAAATVALNRSLVEKGAIPQEHVRDAESVHRTAVALLAAAKADRKAAEAALHSAEVDSDGLEVRKQRVAVLESAIAALRAELNVAEADLEGTVIRAPGDGAVVHRIMEPGTSVVVGQPILSLWIGREVWVEAWIDEDELAHVKPGCPAKVTLKSYPDREFSGVVETIAVSTDFELPESEVPQPRATRMRATPVFAVRVRLDDAGDDLFPGLSAVVGIRKHALGFLPALLSSDDREDPPVAKSR